MLDLSKNVQNVNMLYNWYTTYSIFQNIQQCKHSFSTFSNANIAFPQINREIKINYHLRVLVVSTTLNKYTK